MKEANSEGRQIKVKFDRHFFGVRSIDIQKFNGLDRIQFESCLTDFSYIILWPESRKTTVHQEELRCKWAG